MIVVADVFSNGAASLADVVQAPRTSVCWPSLNLRFDKTQRLFQRHWIVVLIRCELCLPFRRLTSTTEISKSNISNRRETLRISRGVLSVVSATCYRGSFVLIRVHQVWIFCQLKGDLCTRLTHRTSHASLRLHLLFVISINVRLNDQVHVVNKCDCSAPQLKRTPLNRVHRELGGAWLTLAAGTCRFSIRPAP